MHSTQAGPAIGGCRLQEYVSTEEAMYDALRLAYMMTIKAAVCGLPHGGAKAVILAPRKNYNRTRLFESFGEFVNDLKGKYITACDVGTQPKKWILSPLEHPMLLAPKKHSKIIAALLLSPLKAYSSGFRRQSLTNSKDMTCPIFTLPFKAPVMLAMILPSFNRRWGQSVYLRHKQKEAIRAATDFGATVVSTNEIYELDCDVFSPCALGSSINMNTLQK